MNNPESIRKTLFSIKSYFIFFLLISSIVTCCFLLFLNGLDLPASFLRQSAPITLGNILWLSLIFTAIDGIRRKLTVERPVNEILKATDKLTQGDFSSRITLPSNVPYMKEFDDISRNFNKMAKELDSVEVLRNDFIANVSHELKTPLSIIQNYASLLKLEDLSDSQKREHTDVIIETSTKLSVLISNILKLNKLENQQITFNRSSFDLPEQLRESLLSYEHLIEEKNLTIQIDFEEISIYEDKELLSIVWNNLISNAIKFTPTNGMISLSCKEKENQIITKVQDTGMGISNDIGNHIFEKFYQGDSSHLSTGNGLGLSLVKRVIELVDGEMTVESTLNEGSTFTILLKKERRLR